MLTCREATELASRALDGELRLRERFSLQLHLALCALCPRYARQLEFLRTASARLSLRFAGGAELSEEARVRLRERLSGRTGL